MTENREVTGSTPVGATVESAGQTAFSRVLTVSIVYESGRFDYICMHFLVPGPSAAICKVTQVSRPQASTGGGTFSLPSCWVTGLNVSSYAKAATAAVMRELITLMLDESAP
jgi:hypothetical protein